MSSPLWDVLRLTTKKAQPVDKLCLRLGISETELRKVAKEANAKGFTIRVQSGHVFSRPPAMSPGKQVVIGKATPGRKHVAVITDMHFGSTHCDKKGLARFMSDAWALGCREVICTGDILDGVKPVLLHEQEAIGFDAQADLAVETVSAGPKFSWVVIGGNHDAYASDAIGIESGKVLADRMQEAGVKWNYAGSCLGHAKVSGLSVQMWHPHGGASTRNAVRRILNARIENMVNQVDALLIGHFHKYCTVQAYPENVYGIAGGTFQLQRSDFAIRMSNAWDVGGSILSYTVDKNGRASEISSSFYPSSQA